MTEIDSGEYAYGGTSSIGYTDSSNGDWLTRQINHWYSMYGEDLIMNTVIPLVLILMVMFAVYFKLKQIQTGSTGLPTWLSWLFTPVGEEHVRDTSVHSTASRQQTVNPNPEEDNSNNSNNNEDEDDDDGGDILQGFRVNVSELEEDTDGVPLISTSSKKHR